MAKPSELSFTLTPELRLCEVKVNGEIGYFHCWEHWANVVEPGIGVGSHPGGQVARVHAIVEFKDGVKRVDPSYIKFCDETNDVLKEFNKMKKLREESNA